MPSAQPLSDRDHHRELNALDAFTKKRSAPRATFALLLVATAVASLAMSFDEVERYSPNGFLAGIGLAGALALAIGAVLNRVEDPTSRLFAMIALPGAAGAFIGVLIQAIVLWHTGTGWEMAVKDMGGLIDTTRPVGWLAGGVFLGGVPALAVTAFLLLAGRALRRAIGHDASESFGVAFVGTAGMIASFGLFAVKGMAIVPLFLVAIASAITVLVAVLVDGSRVTFLRNVYARTGEGFDIVPAEQFATDPTLAPMVAAAGGGSVLVRLATGEYRASAMTPIALVAETEEETLRPLLRRRKTATIVLGVTSVVTTLAFLLHA